LTGEAVIVFPLTAARRLVNLLTHEPEDSPDSDFMLSSTLSEVGNIVLNSVVGSLTNALELGVHYELPLYSQEPLDAWLGGLGEVGEVLLVRTRFQVHGQPIEGDFLLCLPMNSLADLFARLGDIPGSSS
jgi:chemotaxis protein CheC